jgi:hypothetical protein
MLNHSAVFPRTGPEASVLTERNLPDLPRRQFDPTAAVSPLGCSAVDIDRASWVISSMSRRRTQEATRRFSERNSNDRESAQHQWSTLQHHVCPSELRIVAELSTAVAR